MNNVITKDGVEVLVQSKDTEIDIDQACVLIGQAWHTTIDSLLNVVLLIRGYMDKKGFKTLELELEKRGLMKRSVFSMFKTIAKNELINTDIKHLLPPAYNSLWYLSKIEDKNVFMDTLKDSGRDTKLEVAKQSYNAYKNQGKEKYQSFKPTPKVITLASLKMARTEVRKNKTEILSLLEKLQGLGVTVNFGKDFK
jgi:hypothetical protein